MKEKYSFKTEYNKTLDFIIELQNNALTQAQLVFMKKKELEEQRKEGIVVNKEKLEEQLQAVEKEWKEQQLYQQSLEHLKTMFLVMGQKVKEDVIAKDLRTSYCGYKILETQEKDRNRISRDLHDCSVQELTTLVHKMEYCIKMMDRDPVLVKLELQTMIELNKSIINGMREIIYDLRPMSLNNIGLVATIDAYCLQLRRTSNIEILFHVHGIEKPISSIVSVTLYRIIQEACSNAIKHACTKRISIDITFLEFSIELDIVDNGIGFDMSQVIEQSGEDNLNGFGFSTMEERARLLNGIFLIDSIQGKGTKIYVSVPVNYTTGNGEENEE